MNVGQASGEPSVDVSQLVLIPPLYIVLLASVSCCLCNAAFNCLTSGHGKLSRTIEKWSRVIRLFRRSVIIREDADSKGDKQPKSYGESDHLLSPTYVSDDHFQNALFFKKIENPEAMMAVQPVVPASVATEALSDSLHCMRMEAQQMVFVYNPKYMIIATVKSLAMLVVLQYHFDYKGGWNRLVVCCAANLMSGLLTPVVEYGARLLLPPERDSTEKMAVAEPEEPTDSVFIVEILVRIGRLELEDLETVLIQGTAFIVFGAVLLPAVVIFCLMGLATFVWVFFPVWLIYVAVRHVYYRHGSVSVKPSFAIEGGGAGGVLLSPAGEFAKAALLKVFTLFLLQWTLQSSFLFGLALLQGGTYHDALRLEVEQQLLGWYDPRELTRFQWFCFASQIFF